MTTVQITEVPKAETPPRSPAPLALRPVIAIIVVLVGVLMALADRYGYHPDEFYFRMLGEHGYALGYVDQPPLLPVVVDIFRHLTGDSLWGIRIPAALCAAGMVLLAALMAAELGGQRRAQVFTALALATSMTVLTFGHWILTSSLDNVAWCAVMLFAMRALLRNDGRWWLLVGAAVGLGLYAKYIVVLAVVALLIGLLVMGPRHHLRQRWLYLGLAIAVVVGAPNLVYQLTHSFPQLEMAEALGRLDGPTNRALFPTNLLFVLGPALTVICVVGMVALLRQPAWRPLRALPIGYLVATVAAYFSEGGRPDYTGGLLIALLVAGCVRTEAWMARRALRVTFVAAGLGLFAALQILLALPVVPQTTLAHMQINSMTLETVGWPTFVEQIAGVYNGLPADERARAVVLVDNFGEAGAIARYGPALGLPPAYSGINELYHWGAPGADRDVVVAVGIPPERLTEDFASCEAVARLDNGLGIESPEQGRAVSVCRGLTASWTQLWPRYRHLSAYE